MYAPQTHTKNPAPDKTEAGLYIIDWQWNLSARKGFHGRRRAPKP